MFTYSVIKTVNLTNQELLSMYVSISLIAEFKLIVVYKQAWKNNQSDCQQRTDEISHSTFI